MLQPSTLYEYISSFQESVPNSLWTTYKGKFKKEETKNMVPVIRNGFREKLLSSEYVLHQPGVLHDKSTKKFAAWFSIFSKETNCSGEPQSFAETAVYPNFKRSRSGYLMS